MDSLRKRAIKLGLPASTVYNRVKRLGWSEEKALSTPIDGLDLELVKRAAENGILAGTLRQRLHLGWDIEKAITTPIRDGNLLKKYEYQGKLWSAAELEEKFGISRLNISHRINVHGWTVERAVLTLVKPRGARTAKKFIPAWFRLLLKTKEPNTIVDSYRIMPQCPECNGSMTAADGDTLRLVCPGCKNEIVLNEQTVKELNFKVG